MLKVRSWVVAAWLTTTIVIDVQAAPVGTRVPIDRTIAHVGDAVIWKSELDVRAKGVEVPQRQALLDEMIDEELVIGEARRAGITIEPSEVQAAFDEIKQQNNLDDAGLDKALHEAGYTRARYLVELERQLLRLRARYQLVATTVQVSDAEIAAEAAKRNLPVPVTDTDKATIERDLRRVATDAAMEKWVAGLRRRTWIQRRP